MKSDNAKVTFIFISLCVLGFVVVALAAPWIELLFNRFDVWYANYRLWVLR